MAETLAEIVDAPGEEVVLESPYTGEIREKARIAVKPTDSVFLIFFDLINTFHLPLLGFFDSQRQPSDSSVKSSQIASGTHLLKKYRFWGEIHRSYSKVNNLWCRPQGTIFN
ncbi:hypothetical protein [Paenibacillus jamilae]|uniref:hypothetical protein n=1 Tax=Paenibacillus jamilae TaxID=114136 RepID=UPI001FCCF12F|nr:hypothetical protein [Paenibacillus jamilae]